MSTDSIDSTPKKYVWFKNNMHNIKTIRIKELDVLIKRNNEEYPKDYVCEVEYFIWKEKWNLYQYAAVLE